MKRIVIFGSFILLLHTILICATQFEINVTEDVQFWEVKVIYMLPSSENNSQELYEAKKLKILTESFSDTIPFGPRQTFILLKKVDTDTRWSIFYWLGEETTVNQRWKTAALVAELWRQIVNTSRNILISEREKSIGIRQPWYKITYEYRSHCIFTPKPGVIKRLNTNIVNLPRYQSIIPIIIREMQYDESNLFIAYFGKYGDKYRRTGDIPDRLKNTDLYEIKLESDRWFINLVPIDIEKENTNVYVLDDREKREIFHQSEENTNSKQLMDLVYCLIYEKLPDNMRIEYFDTSADIDDHVHIMKILSTNSVLNTEDESNNTLNYENEDFCRDTSTGDEETKVLYKLSSSRTEGMKWYWVPLSINNIMEDTPFILLNRLVKNFYLYLGKMSSLNKIKYALETLERCLNRYKGWRQVIFAVYDEFKQPAVFWVNFQEYADYIYTSKIPPLVKSLIPYEHFPFKNLLYLY